MIRSTTSGCESIISQVVLQLTGDTARIIVGQQARHPEKLFVLPAPSLFEIDLVVTGPSYRMLETVTRQVELENDFCRIAEERHRTH